MRNWPSRICLTKLSLRLPMQSQANVNYFQDLLENSSNLIKCNSLDLSYLRLFKDQVVSTLENENWSCQICASAFDSNYCILFFQAGGVAGTAVDVILFPFDTLKTRLQSAEGFAKAGGFRGIYSGLASCASGSAPSGIYIKLCFKSFSYRGEWRRG